MADGKPQQVRMIARDSDALPVHAVIVLQVTASNEAALAKIRKTASIISGYITNDMETGAPSLVGLVTVSDDVRIEQNLTSDPNLLDDAFDTLKPKGNSARLLDGVSMPVTCWQREKNGPGA